MRAAGRRALVCYLTAGHPDRGASIETIRAVADAGADVIELGVPFSDPVADGPVIQESSQRALEAGGTLAGTLEIAREAGVGLPPTAPCGGNLPQSCYSPPRLAAGSTAG